MLLVFVDHPPDAERAFAWARIDARGDAVARGEAKPGQWPHDDDIVVVLAAAQARVVALAMPPMSRERLERAVRLALDDAIASDPDATAIALAERGQGNVLVALASRALLDAVERAAPRARIVAGAAIAPLHDGWTWFRPAGSSAFVRRDDGSAFCVGDTVGGELPSELGVALAQARTPSGVPAIRCAFVCAADERARWSSASGVPFLPAAPWRFEQATRAAIANAPDFASERRPDRARAPATWRAFRPALMLGALALVVHLASLAAMRAALAVENARLSHALVAEAAALKLPGASTPERAAEAIARTARSRLHAAGRSAPEDALPLLARAAPALKSLPAGTLRSAHYASDAWTLELAALDRDALSRTSRALAAAGLDVLAAPVSGGTRMRVALAPTAK